MKMQRCDVIDIVKMDIKGAEKEVFSKNISWLDRTKVIIELHDYLREGCSDAFYSVINPKEWDKHRWGGSVVLARTVKTKR